MLSIIELQLESLGAELSGFGIKLCHSCLKEKSITCFQINKEESWKADLCNKCSGEKPKAVKLPKKKLPKVKKKHKTSKEQNKRRNQLPYRKMRNNISKGIRRSILIKTNRTVEYVGCDIKTLRFHLESQFKSGMSWDNYGLYWVIDHIFPLAAFDMNDPDEILWAWNYKNLQPLEKKLNEAKSDNIASYNVSELKQKNLELLDKLKYQYLINNNIIIFSY